MKKKTIAGLAALGAVLGAATAAGIITAKRRKQAKLAANENKSLPKEKTYYFAGGGLAALSGAYYLIHDCNVKGERIHIFEDSSDIGGAMNIGGDSETGYICTSPKLLSYKNHANLMNMLKNINSANCPEISVYDEIMLYAEENSIYENSRLAGNDEENLGEFDFSNELLKDIKHLIYAHDDEISDVAVEEYFSSPHEFLTSSLWEIISSAYMLKPDSSAVELKHILNSNSADITQLFNMTQTIRPQFNLQETIVKAIKNYLVSKNVNFATHCSVHDVDFAEESNKISALHINDNGTEKTFYLNDGDVCFITNGSVSECASIGDYDFAAPKNEDLPTSAELWRKMADKHTGLGCPETFYNDADTEIISFTITSKSPMLTDMIRDYTGNSAGAITTFVNSPWKMTVSCMPAPYFTDQKDGVYVICGYGLNVHAEGRYIDKTMSCASGAEILFELVKHIKLEDRWDLITEDIINVIPCSLPYATAASLPYYPDEKPEVVPFKDGNFAFIGQFAKLDSGISMSSEYVVRTAAEAAYRLTGTRRTPQQPQKAKFPSYIKMMYSLKK